MKKAKGIKNKQWLSIEEYARKSGKSITTIHNKINDGTLIFQYFGKQKFIDSFKFNPKKLK